MKTSNYSKEQFVAVLVNEDHQIGMSLRGTSEDKKILASLVELFTNFCLYSE